MISFIRRLRSELWISVNINNIVTSYKFKELLSFNLGLSDNYWCKTRNNNYLLNLDDILLEQKVQNFLDYINGFIWLNLNNHIKNYFDNNVLDYCVARDLNFLIDCNIDVLIEQYQSFFIYNKKNISRQRRLFKKN